MTSPEFDTIRSGASKPYTVSFAGLNQLPSSATISSATVAAIDLADGSSANSILSSTTATTTTTTASIRVTIPANSDGKRYKITFSATCSEATILPEVFELRVRD